MYVFLLWNFPTMTKNDGQSRDGKSPTWCYTHIEYPVSMLQHTPAPTNPQMFLFYKRTHTRRQPTDHMCLFIWFYVENNFICIILLLQHPSSILNRNEIFHFSSVLRTQLPHLNLVSHKWMTRLLANLINASRCCYFI